VSRRSRAQGSRASFTIRRISRSQLFAVTGEYFFARTFLACRPSHASMSLFVIATTNSCS
jgi:hypothetical protein